MKAQRRAVIGGLSLLFFALCTTFSIMWNSQMERLSLKMAQDSAYALTTSDCRCCHGTVVDRHHQLATSTQYACLTCHEMSYEPVTQAYTPLVQRDCTVCHIVGVSLDDRHHVQVQQQNLTCFTCHQVLTDPVEGYFYVTLNRTCDASEPGSSVSHYSSHNVAPADCSVCHLNNLIDEHYVNPSGCDLCHLSPDPGVQGAVQNKDTSCTVCHTPLLPHPAPSVPTAGTITGAVTDTTGSPLSAAVVTTDTGGYSTTTATDGSFSLTVAPGTYAVTASSTGHTSSSTAAVVSAGQTVTAGIVCNAIPAANAGPDQTVTAGRSVTLSGSGSSDPDGTISAYSWNFGDGTTGSGVSAMKVYATAGTYTVRLTVTDNAGASAPDTAIITVQPAPPPAVSVIANKVLSIMGLKSTAARDSSGSRTIITQNFRNNNLTEKYAVESSSGSSKVVSMKLNTEASSLTKISIRLYVSSLGGSGSRTIRIYPYRDSSEPDMNASVTATITSAGWKEIDVTPLKSRMSGFGWMKFRITTSSSLLYLSEGNFIEN